MVFTNFIIFLFLCKEEKFKENWVIFKSAYLVNYWHDQRKIWYATIGKAYVDH